MKKESYSLINSPNCLYLKEALKLRRRRAAKRHTSYAVMLLDIDRFSAVYTHFSKQTSDEILTLVAKALEVLLYPLDLLLHLEHDRFIILFEENATYDRIIDVAIYSLSIFDSKFYINGHKISLTASVGLASITETDRTALCGFKKAFKALYCAKKEGGNRFSSVLANNS